VLRKRTGRRNNTASDEKTGEWKRPWFNGEKWQDATDFAPPAVSLLGIPYSDLAFHLEMGDAHHGVFQATLAACLLDDATAATASRGSRSQDTRHHPDSSRWPIDPRKKPRRWGAFLTVERELHRA
jgi:hypothetical protein